VFATKWYSAGWRCRIQVAHFLSYQNVKHVPSRVDLVQSLSEVVIGLYQVSETRFQMSNPFDFDQS
jgi:hypothetical protein